MNTLDAQCSLHFGCRTASLHFNQFADVSAFSDELSCHRTWLGGIDLEIWANSATIRVADVVSKSAIICDELSSHCTWLGGIDLEILANSAAIIVADFVSKS